METVYSPNFTEEQIKFIMSQTKNATSNLIARSSSSATGLGSSWSPGCTACEIGLNVGIGAVVAGVVAAFVAGSILTAGALDAVLAPVVALIATATGLNALAISSVFSAVLIGGGVAGGAAAVEAIISGLCNTMGACS